MSTIPSRDNLTPRYYDRSGRLLVRAAALAAIFILAFRTAEYLGYAVRAIGFPFELEYGEGIVWQQALLIPGPRMYGSITHFPFIVFQYPPVYYLIVRALVALGVDPLAAGRGVTLTATIAAAILVGSIVSTAMRDTASTSARVAGAAMAGLMMFSYYPVQAWAVTMRVDMLAVAFSIAGVYLTIVAAQRTIILCAAIFMFVLAVYTKQTELAAPIAAILVATVLDVGSALRAVVFGLLLGGSALIVLELSTDGGFWHNIVDYNLHNPFSLKNLIDLLLHQKRDDLAVLFGVAAFAFLWWTEAAPVLAGDIASRIEALRQSRKLRALVIVTLWFGLASVQIVSAGKWGSSTNYFIEWVCITTVPVGMVVSLAWHRATTRNEATGSTGLAGVLLSLALMIQVLDRPLLESRVVYDPKVIALSSQLVNLIRQNPKPTLSEDMVLLLRAGQEVPIEPAGFAALTRTGMWDQRPFLHMINDHAFGLIILQDYNNGRFTKKVMTAIQNNYPLVEHRGNYVIRRPSG